MGYKSSFLDNEIYGAEDVSRVFSHLVSGGVVAYPENLTVAQSIDAMTSEITTEGVSGYGGLAVTKTATGVKIGEGAGFFESGVLVEVDADGVELEMMENSDAYIYFAYEKDFNRVEAYASAQSPTGDVLLLALVSASGGVTDLRSYANSKLVLNVPNYYYDFTVTNSRFESGNVISNANTTYYTMPHNGFHYLILTDVEGFGATTKFGIIDLNAAVEEEQAIQIERSDFAATVKVLRTGTELRIRSVRGGGITMTQHTYHMRLI